MKNIYCLDDVVSKNDLYFMCYMIERVARKIHQRNLYVVNGIGTEELYSLIKSACVLHCENPQKIEDEWIKEYNLSEGDFDVCDIDTELCETVPSATSIGKVYKRLICDTLLPDEDYVQGLIRVYNDPICSTIDNYNASAYYEPSYVVARAYNNGGF